MSNVAPAPLRIETGSGECRLRSGIRVEYDDAALMPIVERFCGDVSRRTAFEFEAIIAEGERGTEDGNAIRIAIG